MWMTEYDIGLNQSKTNHDKNEVMSIYVNFICRSNDLSRSFGVWLSNPFGYKNFTIL